MVHTAKGEFGASPNDVVAEKDILGVVRSPALQALLKWETVCFQQGWHRVCIIRPLPTKLSVESFVGKGFVFVHVKKKGYRNGRNNKIVKRISGCITTGEL